MCDVYSFGVVLLELLTGKRTIDRNRPRAERYLVNWARPMLKDFNKLEQILDATLEGQYSTEGVKRAAKLAYKCLRREPKARPTMSSAVETLEPLLEFNDIPRGPFVCIVSPEGNTSYNVLNNSDEKGEEKEKKKKEDNGGHWHREGQQQQLRTGPSRSRGVCSDSALYKVLGSRLYSPKRGNRGQNEP